MIEQAVEPSVARSIVGRPPRSLVERQICDPGAELSSVAEHRRIGPFGTW